MKKNSVLIALFVAVTFLLFPLGAYAADEPSTDGSHNHSDVSSESTDGVNKDQPEPQKETVVTYSSVQCGYFIAPLDEIGCGLFPLKQGIGLLVGYYVDQLKLQDLVQTAVDAGIKHINEFKYQESNVKNLDVAFESMQGMDEDYVPDDWQMQRLAYMLKPLVQKLAEARPAVDKMGPRVLELLLKETRDAAIAALVEKLHPHTNYFSLENDKRKKMLADLRGTINKSDNLVGIGAALGEFGSVYVVMPLPDTPAGRALKRYDEILAVTGVSVATLEEAIPKIRGTVGESVNLKIRRDGVEQDIVLVREEIKSPPSAVGQLYVIGNIRVCYLFVSQFTISTHDEVRAIFGEKGACEIADTYVLDLRNNGGGVEGSAIGLAQELLPPRDARLPEELLLLDVGTMKSEKQFRDSTQSIRDWKIRPIVLQNNHSASGSELVIGALRPYVTLVGIRTYGKFSSWVPFLLADGSLLQITASRFSFKDGVNYDGYGFDPDIYFNRPMFRREIPKEKVKREEDLPRYRGGAHQQNEQEKLFVFISEHDPEFAIGLGLIAHSNQFSPQEKGGAK